MTRAIEVSDLTYDYGKGRGIFNVDFAVDQGEVFGFLGPNGAGKTTTIRHLMGFVRAQKGDCRIGGLSCWSDAPTIQRMLGYIPGEISFWNDMTGEQFLKFLCRYRGLSGTGRLSEMLERFELDPRIRLKSMSKGTRQKVGIAAAFVHDPSVLILDEPTSGLDPLMQNRFIDFLVEIGRAAGRAGG